MPWAYYEIPSIQLGALKAYLQENNVKEVKAEHFFVKVAHWLSVKKYRSVYVPNIEDAEALYGALLFDEVALKLRTNDLLTRKLGIPDSNIAKSEFFDDFHAFHEEEFRKILDVKYDLIGFTLNFGQTLASIYAARLIKKMLPDCKTIFGGAEVSDELGVSLLQTFPNEIDFICNGEGEKPLLDLINNNLNASKTKGIVTLNIPPSHFNQVNELDSLPCPDYDEYFDLMPSKDSKGTFGNQLPYESSRGCYYACNFCALNLQWNGYRQKTPDKVFEDVTILAEKYQKHNFFYVDNITPTNLKERSRLFHDSPAKYGFFYEARATLTKTQLTYLKEMGVNTVQLGIESFSNGILKKFNKKSTVMHNIAAIKHCVELGIKAVGNVISDYPFSEHYDIEESIVNIELCFAYPPVATISPYALEVGSPDYKRLVEEKSKFINYKGYLRAYPEYLLRNIRLPRKQIEVSQEVLNGWNQVRAKINEWNNLYDKNPMLPRLTYKDKNNNIIIADSRQSKPIYYSLDKEESSLFRLLNETKEEVIIPQLTGMDEDWVNSKLQEFVKLKIAYRERGKCIVLPVASE